MRKGDVSSLDKEKYKKNVILIMSGGSGSRFGADCPKQYCMMDNRYVIDYVMDACRYSKLADEIVVVAAADYTDFIQERYGVPVVCGGKSRPESVANGIRYIHDHYECEKLVITNAVCPLATSEQYDRYFHLLEKYDYVLTTWKLAPALQRFDGTRVDRDDFFNVMEPDAYRFPVLYRNFDFKSLKKYIFHNMPYESNAYYCFDYPYTMKLTYPHDLKLLEILYKDIVEQPQKEGTLQIVNSYLSADGRQGVGQWIASVQMFMREMAQAYSVTSYRLNSQTEANIVFEAETEKRGALIFKFTPTFFHFRKEFLYYKYASKKIMAELVGWDEEYNVLVLKKVKPGLQVKYDAANPCLRNFYDRVNANLIPEEYITDDVEGLPTVMEEFEEYVNASDRFTFRYNFRKVMEKKARKIWEKYFEDVPKFYLHRDLHRRNILMSADGYVAIDPRGAIGPREYEYVIPFIIELREKQERTVELYKEMFEYFSVYCDRRHLAAALFIFWVYKMDDYVFQKNDNYKLADWCAESIVKLYFPDESRALDDSYMPDLLKVFDEDIRDGEKQRKGL